MYKYKKRTGKIGKFFLIFLLIFVVSALSVFAYKIYISTTLYSQENESSSYKTTKLSVSTNIENQVQVNDITNILDKTIKCVVGVSKIKNTGNSIFLNNSTQELGLGTGIIVTSNRIYYYELACRW